MGYTCRTTRWRAFSLRTGVRRLSRSPGHSTRRSRTCSRWRRADAANEKDRMNSSTTGEFRELGLAAAARAIRNGEVSSETYVTRLLERAREHAHLKAFITI